MKPLTLALVVAVSLSGIGCSAEAEEAPAKPEVVRLASSLERKLQVPIAIPADTEIGRSIDDLVEARAAALTAKPFVNVATNGKRCTIVRFDDASGVEQMRRERCDGAADKLRVGEVLFQDDNGDGKIDHVTDSTAASYELLDEDHDGKMDRMVESMARVKTPIALTDFAENVIITRGGTIASRTRQDNDHDGKFDLESVTATTSFQIIVAAEPNQEAP